MARPRKIEVPAAAEDFASFVALFKAEHPKVWAEIELGPLSYGLDVMVERLK